MNARSKLKVRLMGYGLLIFSHLGHQKTSRPSVSPLKREKIPYGYDRHLPCAESLDCERIMI